MAEIMVMPWWLVLIWGLLSLIVGLMFVFTPGVTITVFVTLIGAYWFVGGLFMIGHLLADKTHIGWKIFLAVINILAGLVILAYPLYSTIFLLAFFVIFMGFWGCLIGCVHLYQGYKSKDPGAGILGVVSLIFGILLLAYPYIAAGLIPFIIGVFAIAGGVAAVIQAFRVKKTVPPASA